VCATGLLVTLLAAPRRNCFFFRWHPETRLLALVVAPTLLILWPIVLYWSRARRFSISSCLPEPGCGLMFFSSARPFFQLVERHVIENGISFGGFPAGIAFCDDLVETPVMDDLSGGEECASAQVNAPT
jgi:hypothetical protein